MSRDATGIYSAWAVRTVACPVCGAAKGERCDLTRPGEHEHETHWDRTLGAPPYEAEGFYDVAQLAAERDGAVRACSGLRKEVKGLNRALRDAQTELRLLRAADRDPTASEAYRQLRALQEVAREQRHLEHTLRTRIGILEKELRDAKASATGHVDEETALVLETAERLLDLHDLGDVLHGLLDLRRALTDRRRCQETRRPRTVFRASLVVEASRRAEVARAALEEPLSVEWRLLGATPVLLRSVEDVDRAVRAKMVHPAYREALTQHFLDAGPPVHVRTLTLDLAEEPE